MDRKKLIKEYIEFFKSKGHIEIKNSSLIPENDPTVLFTTAGMHPLVPFLLGEKHPEGKKLVNVQRCIRTGDIEDVGDTVHHTLFEMLGNWSLGDYFKEDAIKFSFEFLTKVLKISKDKIAVSVFKGDKNAPRDNESAEIWKSLGISEDRIAFLSKEDNWWGPAGTTGPCGSSTEMFYWKLNDKPVPKKFNPNDDNWVEIWNDVLMQYNKDKKFIFVDGMHCIYDKNFKLNKKLLDIINSFNTHTLLVVNKHKEKGLNLVKENSIGQDTNWEAFSLEKKEIKKDNPEYFKTLLKTFNLIPEEIIYFDHDKKNVDTAKKLGIPSLHYTDNKSVNKFIEDNLFVLFPAKQKNIDTGMGVERTVAILEGFEDNYLADMWKPIIEKIELLSKHKYDEDEKTTKAMRIIADHIKAAVFMINDGVVPGNSEQGYVLRRLIRRAIRYGRVIGIENFTTKIADPIYKIYDDYKFDINKISLELKKEEENFLKTLEQGLRIFDKIAGRTDGISGKNAFLLYQSYGFPIEITKELAKEKKLKLDEKSFYEELKSHQELSRTASVGKFKSGLADNSEKTKKLHTACHMLNQALKEVLNNDSISQKGSNITAERLRFDFNFDRKLTDDEKRKIEDLINRKIKENISVTMEEMELDKAKTIGAQGVFDSKYGEKVKVYSIGDFSKEICAGPHVENTSELGHFKIKKEQSSSSGVRRIKAVLE